VASRKELVEQVMVHALICGSHWKARCKHSASSKVRIISVSPAILVISHNEHLNSIYLDMKCITLPLQNCIAWNL
jgi:hypothetical protein